MVLIGVGLIGCDSNVDTILEPTWQVQDVGNINSEDRAEVSVSVKRRGDDQPLMVRAIVTGIDGEKVDGSGYGLYADGRFFADGEFRVELPPGKTHIKLRSGPEHVPVEITLNAKAGRHQHIDVNLPKWFSPRDRGWYGVDNHVHAQHDPTAEVSTGLGYTVLQARANGLSYITEAGSNVDYSSIDTLSSDEFVIHRADELRPGPFVGHLNTPGIESPIEDELYEHLKREPLPVQKIHKEVHRRGGAVIYTHPMTPPQQLHWMGAGELYSDAVMGRTADAMDIDARHTELFWFSVLNMGNRIAATASTDAALGRTQTLSPGDRRVYVQLDELSPKTLATAIRNGRTFATNGGPLFLFLNVDGHTPGDVIEVNGPDSFPVELEVQSLHSLQSVQLYQRGKRVVDFDMKDVRGLTHLSTTVDVSNDNFGWLVARAENENGDWAITSPVYFEPVQQATPPGESMILTIGNHTRFIELRPDFFAHMKVTVSPGESLEEVALMRDGEIVHRFIPEMGDLLHDGRIPVTQIHGEYGPGWLWHPDVGKPVHFQADWPIIETGWYALRAITNDKRLLVSDAIRFDAGIPYSRQYSLAHLRGGDTDLTLYGYGEEMPLNEIELPFEGDHWWYPQNTYFRLNVRFGTYFEQIESGQSAGENFRRYGAE